MDPIQDLDQMYEDWIESTSKNDRISKLEADVTALETRMDSTDGVIKILETYKHPDREEGGHYANAIKSDENINLQKYIDDVIDARMGELNLATLLNSVQGFGSTITVNFTSTAELSPASVSVPGDRPYTAALFTFDLDTNVFDKDQKAKVTASIIWNDKFNNDNTFNTSLKVKINDYELDLSDKIPAENINTVVEFEAPAGSLKSGLNGISFNVTNPAGGKSWVFGNKAGNQRAPGVTAAVTHRVLNDKENVIAARIVFIGCESTNTCAITELELYNYDTKLAGLTATATSSADASTGAEKVVDGLSNTLWKNSPSTPPSVASPQALMVKLPALTDVTALRWTLVRDTAAQQPLNYIIQFSKNTSAVVTDPLTSNNWYTVDMLNGKSNGTEQAEDSLGVPLFMVSGFMDSFVFSNVKISPKQSNKTIVLDSQRMGSVWTRVTWGFADQPQDTSLTMSSQVGNDPNSGPVQVLKAGEKPFQAGRYLCLTPQFTLNSNGEYPTIGYLSASWIPDPDGEIKADLFSLKVNLIRMNWELRRYKSQLQSQLSQVLMDVFRDTSGIDSAASSNWVRQTLPNAWGILAQDDTSPCMVQTPIMNIPGDISQMLVIADVVKNNGNVAIQVSKDGGRSWKDVYEGYMLATSDLLGTDLVVRFHITGNAILRAWAVYY